MSRLTLARVAAAVFAVPALALLGLAAPAGASTHVTPETVNPTVLYTGPSNAGGLSTFPATPTAEQPCAPTLTNCTDAMAGWYTSNFAETFTQVDATFSLNAEAAGIGVSCILSAGSPASCWSSPVSNPNKVAYPKTIINGAIGAQLCENTAKGAAAQIGAANLGPIGFGGEQEFALGYITGDLNGLTSDPCVGGGVIANPNQFNLLGAFAAGSQVQAQIKQEFVLGVPTGLLFSAQLVNGVTDYSYLLPGFLFYPNEAGAGLQADTEGLSAPASNDLTDFTGVTATSGGVTDGLAHWNAVQVNGSEDGIAPALLAPTAITPGNGTVCVWHPPVWHPGHWKPGYFVGTGSHRHWIHGRWFPGHLTPGYKTCSGGGASSFSVDAGTPVS